MHSENVLFKGIGTDDPEIVPIDLESIQEDAETGLYRGRALKTQLYSAENELVNKFQSIVMSIPFRLVAIATGEFLGCLNEPTFYEKIADALIRRLENLEYKLTCSKEKLLRLVIEEYLNHDVPYLVKHEDRLFYGPLRLQKIIALKNR